MYNIIVERIVKLLLPPILRKERNIAFLSIPFNIIKSIITELKTFRDKNEYFSRFNSQTIYLQHFLNDNFDSRWRRIYIKNVSNIFYNYFYYKAENISENYFFRISENIPYYLKKEEEYNSNVDFIVFIPASANININQLKSYIEYYKVAGKLYEIQTY